MQRGFLSEEQPVTDYSQIRIEAAKIFVELCAPPYFATEKAFFPAHRAFVEIKIRGTKFVGKLGRSGCEVVGDVGSPENVWLIGDYALLDGACPVDVRHGVIVEIANIRSHRPIEGCISRGA